MFGKTWWFKGLAVCLLAMVGGVGFLLWHLAPEPDHLSGLSGGGLVAQIEQAAEGGDNLPDWAKGNSAPLGPTAFTFGDDQELNDAVKVARERQQQFEKAFSAKEGGRYSVKVILSDGDVSEPVWVRLERIRDGDYIGTVANLPDSLKFISKDQSIQIGRSEVVDWMIQRDDGIFGAYTTRVILARSPEANASDLLKLIKDL